MKVTHKELIDNALSEIETLEVDDAVALLEKEDTVFVDLREPRELQREGKIKHIGVSNFGVKQVSRTLDLSTRSRPSFGGLFQRPLLPSPLLASPSTPLRVSHRDSVRLGGWVAD